MTRSFRPSGGGSRRFTPPATERRSGLAHKPGSLRPAWLKAIEACIDAVGHPEATPHDFAHLLRGLDARTFPIATGDARKGYAEGWVKDAKLWVVGTPPTRTAFGPALKAKALALQDLLYEAGAALAAQSRARQGLGD